MSSQVSTPSFGITRFSAKRYVQAYKSIGVRAQEASNPQRSRGCEEEILKRRGQAVPVAARAVLRSSSGFTRP